MMMVQTSWVALQLCLAAVVPTPGQLTQDDTLLATLKHAGSDVGTAQFHIQFQVPFITVSFSMFPNRFHAAERGGHLRTVRRLPVTCSLLPHRHADDNRTKWQEGWCWICGMLSQRSDTAQSPAEPDTLCRVTGLVLGGCCVSGGVRL